MVSWIDKQLGIVERTSAEFAEGSWVPGMPTTLGFFWATRYEGQPVAAFEVAAGQVVFSLSKETVRRARKVASALNIVVEVAIPLEYGTDGVLTIIGPRGRVKKIFAFIGHPI